MGRDKAGLLLEGATFLDRIHGVLFDVFSEVRVFGGTFVPAGGVLVPDDVPGQGPLGGLLTAMRISGGRPVFVASVDTPLLTADVVRSVADPVVRDGAVRVATAGGRIHPLVAVYGAGMIPVVQKRFDAANRSVHGVIDDCEQVVEVEVDLDAVFNVNTETDYEQLIRRFGL